MSLTLPEHIRSGRDHRGKVFQYIYTDEYTGDSVECSACHAGKCVQKLIWYTNSDGTIDTDSHIVIHDMGHELS